MNEEIPFSERVFFSFADKNEKLFGFLKEDLLQANMKILYQNYVSQTIFYTLIFLFFSIVVSIILYFLTSNWASFLILIIPFVLFIFLLKKPSIEAKNIAKKINEELPFAVIYMAAISQSNIEPLRMFKLIANSKEYPNIAFEIKKIINQAEFFGYNFADVLKDYSSKTRNEKLKDLFNGMAINIISGGSLKNFLEKKAESLFFEYKMERQKYNYLAGTFLDVYISLLIVGPLILIITLVLITISGFKMPIPLTNFFLLFIFTLILLNFIFLIIIELKQPKT